MTHRVTFHSRISVVATNEKLTYIRIR